MMRKIFSILTASIFLLLFHTVVCAIPIVDHPLLETVFLKLPKDSNGNWKEITRSVTEKEGVIECIPFNQTAENWSELIGIQFCDRSGWDKKIVNSVENMLELLREDILSAYPKNKVTWNIIEKNQNDSIYEWVLHKPYKDVPPTA